MSGANTKQKLCGECLLRIAATTAAAAAAAATDVGAPPAAVATAVEPVEPLHAGPRGSPERPHKLQEKPHEEACEMREMEAPGAEKASLGLGRIVTLHYLSSPSCQICKQTRYLCF